MKLVLSETPIVFLSYDEPNADRNFVQLRSAAPHALRVHGVKGFDAAHKAAVAEATKFYPDATHIVTVDADNFVDPEFFKLTLHLGGPDDSEPSAASAGDISGCVLSFSARNLHNGLVYGNGGIKVWPKSWILGMQTHEVATGDKSKLDFCWEGDYIQLRNVYSQVWYGSEDQAWRAGFREGVKTATINGEPVNYSRFWSIPPIALHRLLVWSAVTGATTTHPVLGPLEYGDAACQGVMDGIYCSVIDETFDRTTISDLDAIQTRELVIMLSPAEVQSILQDQLNFKVPKLDGAQAAFIRDVLIGVPTQSRDPLTRTR